MKRGDSRWLYLVYSILTKCQKKCRTEDICQQIPDYIFFCTSEQRTLCCRYYRIICLHPILPPLLSTRTYDTRHTFINRQKTEKYECKKITMPIVSKGTNKSDECLFICYRILKMVMKFLLWVKM